VITFPDANKQQISDHRFLAAWNFWFQRFQPERDPVTDAMPILVATESLAKRVGMGVRFSLDVMCRLLVNPSYRNTAQAMSDMVTANAHLLEEVKTINPLHDTKVNGVRLTERGRELLQDIRVVSALEAFADACDEGDGSQDETTTPDVRRTESGDSVQVQQSEFPAEIVKKLVTDIETEPFVAMYRQRAFGSPLTGWRARLEGYYWPNPSSGYAATCAELAPLLDTARKLVDSLGQWTKDQRKQAVEFASRVFEWGGVVQRTDYDWQDVEAVLGSAVEGCARANARMNSGWTKVAAFATAHLELERNLVIWDSRVAHSLVQRIDRILHEAGHREVPEQFLNIGWVPGRGGSRSRRQIALKGWRNGYQKWEFVYAGSALVRAICNELNSRERLLASDDRKTEPWTLRQVEMVLFMDGY
jgi:hypothetical protein